LRASVSDLFQDFIALVYPRYCLACHDGLIRGEEIICTTCIHELPRTHYHLEKENPIYKRLFGRLPLQYAFAFLHFTKGGRVQHLLHAFKYSNRPEVGRIVGRVYGEELRKSGLNEHFDSILPIPLHPTKQRRRGYNQSAEFGHGLAQSLQIRCVPDAIAREVRTDTQTRKSKLKRWENVREVFQIARPDEVERKRILLVDDVITTGATLEACGQVLLEAGCSEISVAGLAYTHE
jgi:ComF family protein